MRAGSALLLAACGHAAPAAPPAPAEDVGHGVAPVVECAKYGMMAPTLYVHNGSDTPADDAITIAMQDFDRATEASTADRYRDSAFAFLDCAHRLVAVVPDDPRAGEALVVAHACYYDALFAFANANDVTREGKAALEAAAAGDPRNADYIRDQLAHAPDDCAAPAK